MAIDFYFAGTQNKKCYELIESLNANVLKSYANDKKDLEYWYERRKAGWQGKLLVDSGAFSVHKSGAHVDVEAYIEYLNTYEEYITFYIQLDHIPGVWGQPRTPEMTLESCNKSWENFQYMYSKLKNPKKLCPVYHMGESLEALDRIIDSDYEFECICISCSKDIQSNQHFDWYNKCIEKIRNKRPNIKIHLLGVGKPKLNEYLDMTSMDATNWIMTGVNGSILTPFGIYCISDRQKKSVDCALNMPKAALEKLENYCKEQGYTLQEASEDYTVRLAINIKYLYNLSQEVQYTKQTTKRRTLF